MKDSLLLLHGKQVRAARGLLGWSQDELARRSQLQRPTIALFEAGKSVPYTDTHIRLRRALENAGVVFLNDGKMIGVSMSVSAR